MKSFNHSCHMFFVSQLIIAIILSGGAVAPVLGQQAGDWDLSFNGTGYRQINMSQQEYYLDVGVQPDGKIIAVGYTHNFNYQNTYLVVSRFNTNGSLDTSFGSAGHYKLLGAYHAKYSNELHGVAIQPDGKIVVVGGQVKNHYPYCWTLVIRLNSDGTLDNSFGNGGQFAFNMSTGSVNPPHSRAYSLKIQEDNKIILSGIGTNPFNSHSLSFARLNPNGSLDATFGKRGVSHPHFPYPPYWANAFDIEVAPDGKYYAAIYSCKSSCILKLNANGSLDASFNGTGYATLPPEFSDASSLAIAIQEDGKPILGGFTTKEGYKGGFIARFLDNGSIDDNFGENGCTFLKVGDRHTRIADMYIYNKAIIGVGSSLEDSGNHAFFLCALDLKGALICIAYAKSDKMFT